MTNQTDNKRQSAITATIREDANGMPSGLQLTFAHGKTIILDSSMIPPQLVAYAMVHGLKQKLVDAAAIGRNPDTGKSATIEDKFAAVHEVYQRLLDGNWNAPREGGGGSTSLLLAALIRHTGKDAETLKAWLEKKTDAEKKALTLNPKVASIINDIRAERAKADDIDTDGLLDELESD
jgi:hypothetical protein